MFMHLLNFWKKKSIHYIVFIKYNISFLFHSLLFDVLFLAPNHKAEDVLSFTSHVQK